MAYSDLGNPIRTQAGATTFVNSPLGITAKKTGSSITYYTRDPNGQILSSHGAGGTVNYVSEYNGSVAALYNPAGAEIGSYRYSPYGQTTVSNSGSSSTAAAANPFRYVGGYQDKTSTGDDGFYKLGARYYDGQGHFTQPDAIAGTISDPKTLTSCNYAGGDPINSSDPSGHSAVGSLFSSAVGCASAITASTWAITAATTTAAPPLGLTTGAAVVAGGAVACAVGTAIGGAAANGNGFAQGAMDALGTFTDVLGQDPFG